MRRGPGVEPTPCGARALPEACPRQVGVESLLQTRNLLPIWTRTRSCSHSKRSGRGLTYEADGVERPSSSHISQLSASEPGGTETGNQTRVQPRPRRKLYSQRTANASLKRRDGVCALGTRHRNNKHLNNLLLRRRLFLHFVFLVRPSLTSSINTSTCSASNKRDTAAAARNVGQSPASAELLK